MSVDWKNAIRADAAAEGFELCGFAVAAAPAHAEFFDSWVERGNAADMDYLGRGAFRRGDPRHIEPSTRTVITLGRRYLPSRPPQVDWRSELRGRIASYALGRDYHRVITKHLKALIGRMQARWPAVATRPYIDTGPVLERDWGMAGGIGWFGKNTNLLHMDHGSWYFLAEILTDLEIEPDELLADRCGSCRKCIDDCPTDALSPGYDLDARRCISYWTIEHRGMIPAEMRIGMGNWVFGCDICQEVCPWNERFDRRNPGPEGDELSPSLTELLLQSEEEFRSRFRATAVLRSKREGLARNAAIALGNSGNPEAVTALACAVREDASAVVRAHAVWALGRIGDPTAVRLIKDGWSSESDPLVKAEMELAVG